MILLELVDIGILGLSEMPPQLTLQPVPAQLQKLGLHIALNLGLGMVLQRLFHLERNPYHIQNVGMDLV